MGCLPEEVGLDIVDRMKQVYSNENCSKSGPTGGKVPRNVGERRKRMVIPRGGYLEDRRRQSTMSMSRQSTISVQFQYLQDEI